MGAVLSYVSIIISTLIQLIYTPLLIRKLGQSEYGLYSLVASIIGYLTSDLCENSSPEEGLKFSDKAYDIMQKIKKFNSERIYKNEKIQPTIRYFTVLMNEIFYVLKNEFNGLDTIKNIKKMRRYYPYLSEEFSAWLENYTNFTESKNRAHRVVYDLNDIKQYSKAIVDYMSGMTDSYIVRMYNEITSF